MAYSLKVKNSFSRKNYRHIVRRVHESMSFISIPTNTVLVNDETCTTVLNATSEAKSDTSIVYNHCMLENTLAREIIEDNISVCCEVCSNDGDEDDDETIHFPCNPEITNVTCENPHIAELAGWAVEENIPHSSVQKLLGVLRNNPNVNWDLLPKSSKTLLKTPYRKTDIRSMGVGHYFYFGIRITINNLFQRFAFNLRDVQKIELAINIDGLPVTKSTGTSLWPILCQIKSVKMLNKYVFPIALYYGSQKPPANDFLLDFVTEAKILIQNGIEINGNNLDFKIGMLVCDTPAKAHILAIKSHNGYFSCTKCCVEGDHYKNVMCYPETEFRKRTDADFRNKTQEEHHIGRTCLEELPNFNLITNVPIDYMHAVLLGVCKRMLCHKVFGWIFGRPPYKLRSQSILNINCHLRQLRKYIPLEFSRRKCRDLNEVKRFKATEFRLLLLYIGPVVFKNVLSSSMYCHFLTLSVAISILLNKTLSSEERFLRYSCDLLKHFVLNSLKVYDLDFVSLNVHSLLHLPDIVHEFGSLEECSAFPFENHMQSLKKKIRKSAQPLQQIIKRISEANFANCSVKLNRDSDASEWQIQHNNGPLYNGFSCPQFKKYVKKDCYTLNISKFADSFIELRDGTIMKIVNFASSIQTCKVHALGYIYKRVKPLFSKPCNSSFISVNCIKDTHKIYSCEVSMFSRKLIVLRSKDSKDFVTFPLLHLNDNFL